MTIKIRSKERTAFLDYIVSGFIEDYGYNGWRTINDYGFSDDAEEGTTWCMVVEIGDGSPEEQKDPVRVDIETAARGIAALKNGEIEHLNSDYLGRILAAEVENEAGNLDVFDVDIVIQAALFGDIVYG